MISEIIQNIKDKVVNLVNNQFGDKNALSEYLFKQTKVREIQKSTDLESLYFNTN